MLRLAEHPGPTVEIPANGNEKEHQRFYIRRLRCVELKRRSYSVPRRVTNCGGVAYGMESLRSSNSAFGPQPYYLSETRHAFCTTAAPTHVLPLPLKTVPYKQWIASVEKQPKG